MTTKGMKVLCINQIAIINSSLIINQDFFFVGVRIAVNCRLVSNKVHLIFSALCTVYDMLIHFISFKISVHGYGKFIVVWSSSRTT